MFVRAAWSLAQEGNIPTFFHSAVLIAVGVVSWIVFGYAVRSPNRYSITLKRAYLWLIGGLLFVYLAMDEAFEIHESVFASVFKWLGLWEKVIFYELSPALWEVLFAPLFITIGVIIIVLMAPLRFNAAASACLSVGALTLWGLALIAEFVQLVYLRDTLYWFSMAVYLEESFEMVASTIFLLAITLIVRKVVVGKQ